MRETLTFVRDNWETISWIATAAALLAVKIGDVVDKARHREVIHTLGSAVEEAKANDVKAIVRSKQSDLSPEALAILHRMVATVDKDQPTPAPTVEEKIAKRIRRKKG